jgi:hypothetical protein
MSSSHTSSINNSPEFTVIDSMFKTNGWNLIMNDDDCVIYSKPGEDTEFFEIKKGITTCSVSFPLKRIPFQYVSKFTDYACAFKYVEARFKDFIGSYPILI